MDRLLTLEMLVAELGVSRSTLYRWMGDALFPGPVHLGPRVRRWRQSEIDNWFRHLKGVRAAPAGKTSGVTPRQG